MILSFLCIPHIPVGHAGGTTPRMGEVEQCTEQLPRAPTVGALGDAGAVAEERKLCLFASRACTPLFRLKLAIPWIYAL
jgi:hypothetical protein